MSHNTSLPPLTMALYDAIRPNLKDGTALSYERLAERFRVNNKSISNRLADLRAAGLIRRIGYGLYEFGPDGEESMTSGVAITESYTAVLDAIGPYLDAGTRISYADVGAKLGISRDVVCYRIRALRDAGIIRPTGPFQNSGLYARGDGTRTRPKSKVAPVFRPSAALCYVNECYEPRAPGAKMCERHRFKPCADRALMAGRA